MKSSYDLYGRAKKEWEIMNPVLLDKIKESEKLITLLLAVPITSEKRGTIFYTLPTVKFWTCFERDWPRINRSLDAQKHCRQLINEPKG